MRELTLVLFGLVLACPLVAIPGTGFDAYRLPFVLIVAAALLVCAFVRSSRGGDRPPGPEPLRTAGLLLLGAQHASLIAARSVADAAAPILTLGAGLAVYSCLRGGLLRKDRAWALLPVISGVALLVGGIGLIQKGLNVEAVSTEGNRNYAGALAAILLPATVAMAMGFRGWRRILSIGGGASLVALLILSESRAGFLAALAGLGAAGLAMGMRKVPRGGVAAAVAALVLVVTFVGSQGAKQLSQSRLETAAFRLEAWKSGLRMLAKRPVLGWGAGGFQTEYPPFRSEAEFQISHNDGKDGFKEVEDPHSSWVATAVETGVPGFLSLLLVAYVAARLWRYYVKHAADPETCAALAGLGGGALAYLVAGCFNTLTLHVSHTVLFWTFLGLIEVLGDRRSWRPPAKSRELRVAVPAAAAIALLFGVFWTVRTGSSDRAYVQGMTSPDPLTRQSWLQESVAEHPQNWRAHYELSRTLSVLKRDAGAAEQARETLKLRPFHVEALNQAAISLLRSGGDGFEAERFLRQAIEVAPYYYKSYFNLALIDGQRGRTGESRCHLTKSIEHKPDHGASYYYRGLAFLIEGDPGAALPDLKMARGLGFEVAAALKADRPSAMNDPGLSEVFK